MQKLQNHARALADIAAILRGGLPLLRQGVTSWLVIVAAAGCTITATVTTTATTITVATGGTTITTSTTTTTATAAATTTTTATATATTTGGCCWRAQRQHDAQAAERDVHHGQPAVGG